MPGLTSGLVLPGLPTKKPCEHFSAPPRGPHVPPTSSSLI
jgi:hypothetical protein